MPVPPFQQKAAWAWALCAAALLLLPGLAASNPKDSLPTFLTFSLTGKNATAQAPDDLFTVIFIADSEARMRGNTNDELSAYIENLVAYKSGRMEYFAHGTGRSHRVDPELVILAGDISVDRGTSAEEDEPLWQPLLDAGIGFLAGFGNHDWVLGDQLSFQGDESNRQVTQFCRKTYRRLGRITSSKYLSYQEIAPTDERGPVTTLASYRGVQLVNFNTFLYEPSYHYDFDSTSGQACVTEKAQYGWAGCQIYTSAESQIAAMENALDPNSATPTLFFQHYPLSTHDVWWEDQNASSTPGEQKKQRLKDMMGRYTHKVFLSGHNHRYAKHVHAAGSGSVDEYIAPYFGGANGDDLNQGGGFLALLVSPTQGIVEVKHVATPLYDPARTTATTTVAVEGALTSTTTTTLVPLDSSVLGSADPDQLQPCILRHCIIRAIACSSDTQCSSFAEPLVADYSSLSWYEKVRIVTMLSRHAVNNPTIHSLMLCVDNNCGSCTVTPCPTTSPAPTVAAASAAASTAAATSAETTSEPSGQMGPLSSARSRSMAALPSALLVVAWGRWRWQ